MTASPSLVDQLPNERHRARVVLLAEPEERLLADARAGVGAGDAHEAVEGGRLGALGEDEGVVLAQRRLGEAGVEGVEVLELGAALAGPEQRLLAHLERL